MITLAISLLSLVVFNRFNPCNSENFEISNEHLIVPNVVHQIYDYQAPNFFLYLSLVCVQRFIKPSAHYLWVNDEGRYRRPLWEKWQSHAVPNTWEYNLTSMIKSGIITPKLITFPTHPPGNTSIYVSNKAHRSDFVRMNVLQEYGNTGLN
jgi:hypothetical protein